MKRTIVESMSIEEAFRALNSKPVVKRMDKQLTESYSNDEMTEFMNWIQNYKNGDFWNDFAAEFDSEQDPDIDVVLTWLENFDEDAYYDYVAAVTDGDNVDEGYLAYYGKDDSDTKAPQWWLDKGGTDASWREQQRINNSGKHDEETGKYIWGNQRVRENANVEEELAEEGYIAHYEYDGSEKKAPQWWLDKGGTDASWREQQRINNSGKHDEETGRYIFGSERRN